MIHVKSLTFSEAWKSLFYRKIPSAENRGISGGKAQRLVQEIASELEAIWEVCLGCKNTSRNLEKSFQELLEKNRRKSKWFWEITNQSNAVFSVPGTQGTVWKIVCPACCSLKGRAQLSLSLRASSGQAMRKSKKFSMNGHLLLKFLLVKFREELRSAVSVSLAKV